MRVLSLAALALLLTGCGGQEAAAETSPRSAAPASRVLLGPLPARPASAGAGGHTDFRKAFAHGRVIDRPDETIHIEVVPLGELELGEDSGLLAGDPMAAHTALPLPLKLPAGRYAVEVSRALVRAKDGTGQAEQVAASRVRLSPGKATQWRWAGNFGVEAGIGAWMGQEAAEILAEGESSPLYRRVAVAAARSVQGMVARVEGQATDIAWCQTGFGDGSYDLWVGVDEAGAPVEVVADYQVLVEPDELIVFVRDPAHEPPGIIPFKELEELGITVRRAHPGETVPVNGAPMWFEIDAQQNRRHPGLGFPEVVALDAADHEVPVSAGNAGFKLWVAVPGQGAERVARLAIAVRTGFKPL